MNFYPIAYSIYLSMTDFSVIHFFNYHFIGLENYKFVLTSPQFLLILKNTVIWSAGSIAVMVPVGFILANIMVQPGLKGMSAFRVVYLIPWAFPAFITILIWSNMLAANGGIINDVLRALHIPAPYWLTSHRFAMLSMILVNLWLSFAYYTFVYTAALQSVPHELYEAASMDGYGALGKLRLVTIPLLKRQIAFITIFGFIFTWNNFYIPFLLTGGGPGYATQIFITYSYLEAFSYTNYALGAAYAIISIIILLVFVVLANKYTRMMSILY
ncbi:carbohydrate ABC transporter permease [Thermogymnomonas acidicola]|uniref:carbohydrate ABC transporter permease n=1 Tax=Thermogymnomonas acidicola TaxID=399579 RepID=UPI001E57A232|nr:sugar ABC transporter permease [Thermogymnomonas acidicola]